MSGLAEALDHSEGPRTGAGPAEAHCMGLEWGWEAALEPRLLGVCGIGPEPIVLNPRFREAWGLWPPLTHLCSAQRPHPHELGRLVTPQTQGPCLHTLFRRSFIHWEVSSMVAQATTSQVASAGRPSPGTFVSHCFESGGSTLCDGCGLY